MAADPQDELVELESWPSGGGHLAEETEVRTGAASPWVFANGAPVLRLPFGDSRLSLWS